MEQNMPAIDYFLLDNDANLGKKVVIFTTRTQKDFRFSMSVDFEENPRA